nr:M4 family metallopeptidase [uncultured Chryseobacterium sp.]
MKKTVTLFKTLTFIFALGFTPSVLTAQNRDTGSFETSIQNLPKLSKTSAMGNFHASFSGQNISSESLFNHLGEWLGTNSDHTFKFVTSSTDDLGFKKSTYQHYYKGIKVADELVLIHEKEGKVTYVNGELSDQISLAIKQPLNRSEVETIVNADMKAPNVTFDEFEQVITKAYLGEGIELHLVSQINALSLKDLKGFMYYIDNTTKKIVKKLEEIHKHNHAKSISHNVYPSNKNFSNEKLFISPLVDVSSTSATYYNGNQQITVDSYNGAYRLMDNARNIHTQDGTGWDGGGNPATGLTGNITEYTNSTANYTAAATKPAVQVHWGMETSRDYYISRHNRNSYDNNGSVIRNYYNINFNTPNTPVSGVNAAAIDVQGIVGMVYGNGLLQGQAGYFEPFVSLDIAGHEYSHLMISRTAGLAYQKESGALNEAFADMFGAAIEFYHNVNPNWTIAEGIPNAALGAAYFRSMSNPNGGSPQIGGQQPDTYQGTYWQDVSAACVPNSGNDYCGVHKNSGVGNYWFYLLSVGGSGTNDLGTSFNVTGITIQKAEKIAYRTLANYLTANSGFINAYNSSKQAAVDLYGAGSNEVQQVENAWCAVGVGSCSNLLAVNEAFKSDLQNIKIYPNPIRNGHFTIESDIKGNADYEIYDLSGKLIKMSQKLENGINKVNVNVQSGVYLVKISAEGSTISKKIIVK